MSKYNKGDDVIVYINVVQYIGIVIGCYSNGCYTIGVTIDNVVYDMFFTDYEMDYKVEHLCVSRIKKINYLKKQINDKN